MESNTNNNKPNRRGGRGGNRSTWRPGDREASIKERQQAIHRSMMRGRRSSHDTVHDYCLICYEPLKSVAVGICNHPASCVLCTARMRSIVGDLKCVLCKTELDKVFITSNISKKFEEFQIWGDIGAPGLHFDARCNMFFEDSCKHELDNLVQIREIRCDVEGCNVKDTFANLGKLNNHLSEAHGKRVCELCWENRHVFPMEQTRFTKKDLEKHCKIGEPGSAFKGHPPCKFCHSRHYNEDFLLKHLRDKHEHCHVCAKLGKPREFFRDPDSLSLHFKEDHFVCSHKSCTEAKFIVFPTEFELRSHMISNHPEMSVDRRVPVNFKVRRARDETSPDIEEETHISYNYQSPPTPLVDAEFPAMGNSSATLAPGAQYVSAVGNVPSRSIMDQDQFPTLPTSGPSQTARRTGGNFAAAMRNAESRNDTTGFGIKVGKARGNKKKNPVIPTREQQVQAMLGTSVQASMPPPPPTASVDSEQRQTKQARVFQLVMFILKNDQAKYKKFVTMTQQVNAGTMFPGKYYDYLAETFSVEEFDSFFENLVSTLSNRGAASELRTMRGNINQTMQQLSIASTVDPPLTTTGSTWATPRQSSTQAASRPKAKGPSAPTAEDFPSLPTKPESERGSINDRWSSFQKASGGAATITVGSAKNTGKKKKKNAKGEFDYSGR